ncbi:MAG: 30S ribosome-binding factor RbfA [Puniceicoccales bacterium]|jgi:ribosome-binding factor A|nr:30S ribosome-binding factor RbfA [Puniceicoccales bacterium]
MAQRMIRLNRLIFRELNTLLHTLFRERADKISITDVEVSQDLRDAHVYFSVVGPGEDIGEAKKFFEKNSGILRHRLFRRVLLKFSPRLNFHHDDSISRGQNVLKILDDLRD